jgi:hypothetical protein
MKIEFNGNSYTIGNRTRQSVCDECIINASTNLECPTDSEGQCILSLNKIYTDLCSNQVFKL